MVGGSVPLAGELVLWTAPPRSRRPGRSRCRAADGRRRAARPSRRCNTPRLRQGCATRWTFGARGSATIGGSIATNAGGINLLRHGGTREQLVGVEAVLGTGDVISRLAGLVKDNTGYDLARLLCGSEGTLGVVTAARLRLVGTRPITR